MRSIGQTQEAKLSFRFGVKALLVTLCVTALILCSGWMAFLYQTTGEGRPVCLKNFTQPSRDAIIRYRVWYHVQNLSERYARLNNKSIIISRFDPDAPVDHAAINDFLSKNPDCCRIGAPGDGQGKWRRAVDLFFGREYVFVSLTDPVLKTPEGYQRYYGAPPINACDKNLERM